jgi:ABC-type bacteriocin/lantibiotic exporter with double-glycine peptidase domain
MGDILSLLNKKQKKISYIVVALILCLSAFELLIFTLIQPIIIFFSRDDGVDKIKAFGNNFNFNVSALDVLIFFFIVFVIRSFLSLFVSYLRQKLIKDINDYLSHKVYSKYLRKNFLFFVNSNSSSFISRIIVEIDKFAYRLIDSLFYLLTDIAIIIIIISYLFYIYFLPALIFFVITLAFFGFFFKTYKYIFKELGQKKLFYDEKKIKQLQDSFYVIQSIKLENLENFFIDKFKISTKKSSHSTFLTSFITELPKNLIEVAMLAIVAMLIGLLFYYFHLPKHEVLSILGLFVFAMFRLLPSSNRVLHAINSIRFHSASINVLKKELELEDDIAEEAVGIYEDADNYKNKIVFNEAIKLKNLSFSYGNNIDILKNINLEIKKNKTIGIKGDSGVGKSTLLNIICYLLFPTEGKFLLDNKEISKTYKNYQKQIGYVPQKIYLTDDSIVNNIIFGKKNAEFDENLFKEVIQKANLEDFLNKLENKENTLIGERGSKLSGGQQQRIGIARALYKKPEIIIFDEATNALDQNSENEILETIKTLKKTNTIIIVSHKDSVLDCCDEIFELKNKQIYKLN